MANIVVVSGSPTANSRLYGLTQYSESQLKRLGHEVAHLQVASLPAEDLIKANFASPAVIEAVAQVEKADAVIIASPVYKASYTGVLKTFLDLIPQKGFQNKVIAPLFIGGTIAHLLSIDYALKPVAAALGATNILSGVYAIDQWVERVEGGGFKLSDELAERLDTAIAQLNEELKWQTLRQGTPAAK
ncbi:NADPH-dependent FMN reductase [Cohnella panacarvi]|uniref:NADPH-dependent FMN reductase n=1 Tax=Cohnella panacarvi TaxID=400776 RepID=UPI000479E8F6|nr:NADPH-dependent FMN reductase [Cohnella panacarvi]